MDRNRFIDLIDGTIDKILNFEYYYLDSNDENLASIYYLNIMFDFEDIIKNLYSIIDEIILKKYNYDVLKISSIIDEKYNEICSMLSDIKAGVDCRLKNDSSNKEDKIKEHLYFDLFFSDIINNLFIIKNIVSNSSDDLVKK